MFTWIKLLRIASKIEIPPESCFSFGKTKFSFSFYIQTDGQRNCINFNADIHFNRPMVRNLLSIALQAATWSCGFMDFADMDRGTSIWLAGIFRSSHNPKATSIWHSTLHSMCQFLGYRRRNEIQYNQSDIFVHVSELLTCLAYQISNGKFSFSPSGFLWFSWQVLTTKSWGFYGDRIQFLDIVI